MDGGGARSRAAQGNAVVAQAQARRVSGRGGVRGAVRRRRVSGGGGAAQEWRQRSGVRARVKGGGFARRKKKPCEADAWGPRKG